MECFSRQGASAVYAGCTATINTPTNVASRYGKRVLIDAVFCQNVPVHRVAAQLCKDDYLAISSI